MRIRIICLLIVTIFTLGCKVEIRNIDNTEPWAQPYLGQKFSMGACYFIAKYALETLEENALLPCDQKIYPTKAEFLSNPDDTSYSNYKVLRIGDKEAVFKIIHAMHLSKNPSLGFSYFIVESMKDQEQFIISLSTYQRGIRNGYIKTVE